MRRKMKDQWQWTCSGVVDHKHKALFSLGLFENLLSFEEGLNCSIRVFKF